MPYQSRFMLRASVAAQTHTIKCVQRLFSWLSAGVFTPWVCASKALCASAASTVFYKANRKIFSSKVNIRCVIMEDVA